MKLISWNVNGIRAAYKKGFLDYLSNESPDIMCVQETKAHKDQLSEDLINIPGYHSCFAQAERKGYSGVAVWSKEKPQSVSTSIKIKSFAAEGRLLMLDFKDFILFNIYFPNGGASPLRLKYKLDFYKAFSKIVNELKDRGKKIVFCGDVNTAHKEIDLARPKENRTNSGFLPEECRWLDSVIESGFIDTFRMFDQSGGKYTYWDMKTAARTRNVGWRLDYFFISENLKKNIKGAFIQSKVMGSDHCPIGIELL